MEGFLLSQKHPKRNIGFTEHHGGRLGGSLRGQSDIPRQALEIMKSSKYGRAPSGAAPPPYHG